MIAIDPQNYREPGSIELWVTYYHCFQILSMVHVRYFSPLPALLFLTALIAAMVLPSNIDMLLKGVVFTLWAFRASCALGIFILRRKMKHVKRPYKVICFLFRSCNTPVKISQS